MNFVGKIETGQEQNGSTDLCVYIIDYELYL